MSMRMRVFVGCALLVAARLVGAQSVVRATQTDPRWYPWLGCWAGESSTGRAPRAAVSCIVPLGGTSGVEALTLVSGKVVARSRIEATGRTQTVDNQGCAGTQIASWSPGGRRIYLRADYTC